MPACAVSCKKSRVTPGELSFSNIWGPVTLAIDIMPCTNLLLSDIIIRAHLPPVVINRSSDLGAAFLHLLFNCIRIMAKLGLSIGDINCASATKVLGQKSYS